MSEFGFVTLYPKVPELCIEIASPSSSNIETQSKVDLYLAKGAIEAWVAYDLNKIHIFSYMGRIKRSNFTNIS